MALLLKRIAILLYILTIALKVPALRQLSAGAAACRLHLSQ